MNASATIDFSCRHCGHQFPIRSQLALHRDPEAAYAYIRSRVSRCHSCQAPALMLRPSPGRIT